VSSFHPARALKRVSINHVPAIGLALAATALTIATPLTAAADSSQHTAATSSVQSAVVRHATAATKQSTAAKKSGATAAKAVTAKPAAAKPAAAKPAAAKPAAAKPAAATPTKAAAKSTTTTAAATKTTTTVSSKPYAGVGYSDLEPTGTEGSQQRFSPNSDQWNNATAIVRAAKDLDLSPYAATIAVATAMQESSLRNLTTAVDHDSLGLFQQRPSMGWGTASELTDPTYAAKAFLKELPSGYQNMNLSDAAQSVQRSFDGSLYSQWESQAAYMVHTIANS
jgi:hypothetical protein